MSSLVPVVGETNQTRCAEAIVQEIHNTREDKQQQTRNDRKKNFDLQKVDVFEEDLLLNILNPSEKKSNQEPSIEQKMP